MSPTSYQTAPPRTDLMTCCSILTPRWECKALFASDSREFPASPRTSALLPLDHSGRSLFFTPSPTPRGLVGVPVDNFEDDLVGTYQPQVFAGKLFYLKRVAPQPSDLGA
jgi:hypothetical protein